MQYHPHFARRLLERRIDPMDAQHVLRQGMIFREPELDIRFQEWRYRVEGKSPDGERLAVIVAFLEIDEVLVLTVMTG